jgi:hypothetical protein
MALLGKGDDVLALIAKKNYAKAIEVLRSQVQTRRDDPRLRLQLGDVLVLAGKSREAVAILVPLADEFAREGFAAKAVAVLKKIQKIDPGRRDVDAKLASLIEEKQRVATVSLPANLPEIGMEEIGIEPPPGGPLAVPAVPAEAPQIAAAPAPVRPAPAPAAPAPSRPPASPAEPALELSFDSPPLEPSASDALPLLDFSAPPPPRPAPAPPPAPVVDRDLFTEEDLEMVEVDATDEPMLDGDLVLEAAPEETSPGSAPADPMSDSRFADEVLSLVDAVFQPVASGSGEPAAATAPAGGSSQIVVSPLFKDFSVDEMVAVIHGLNLLTFERGDVIIRQGEHGQSLYMLTSGRVRAFVKDRATGKQVKVGDLTEGAFFGEVSMLTGQPRSATVAALTRCELLELDRSTLDSITATHPHVLDVLQEFARQRTARAS